ncbi:MAG: GNAT family N-acetyltransferase [Sphingomonadales bacterium 12-68-11]|nr:MAG: GNAT family N-acetyltransferase [Sphingomonadales bacterium 12-68-11]OYX16934.1 MAG: GNAT family N-acetyltransferase [Sphingomonadales bacterium 32-67-7]
MPEIRAARFPEDRDTVEAIFREFILSPQVSLAYQDYEPELAALPGKYAPPLGTVLLAWQGGRAVGCVALRPVDEAIGEMKRLYVRPAGRGRGLGLGRDLVEAVVEAARAAGYRELRLDVLPEFERARALYERAGFRPAPAVTYNPVPGAEFLGLRL